MLNLRGLGAIAAAGALALSAGGALAAPVPNVSPGVPNLYDAVNLLLGTGYASNIAIEGLRIDDADDQAFLFTSGTPPLIGLSNAFLNELGIYSNLATGGGQTLSGLPYSGSGFTGDGTAADPFSASAFVPDPSGPPPKGLFLSVNGTASWFSGEALNSDGVDHMVSYDLGGPLNGIVTDAGTFNFSIRS
jgi:hypothetical protein